MHWKIVAIFFVGSKRHLCHASKISGAQNEAMDTVPRPCCPKRWRGSHPIKVLWVWVLWALCELRWSQFWWWESPNSHQVCNLWQDHSAREQLFFRISHSSITSQVQHTHSFDTLLIGIGLQELLVSHFFVSWQTSWFFQQRSSLAKVIYIYKLIIYMFWSWLLFIYIFIFLVVSSDSIFGHNLGWPVDGTAAGFDAWDPAGLGWSGLWHIWPNCCGPESWFIL